MATRMQQRKGTAAQWISTNSGDGPVLNAGEIGFELDTNKFKIGDGVNHWVDLIYFTDSASALAAINAVIDAAPAALNTLNELAAAINDDPAFFTTIATNLTNHQNDTTSIHGIADTALLATKSYADTAVSTHNDDTTNVHGILDTADLATQDYVLDQISNSTDAYPDMAGDGISWDAVNEAFDVDNTVARVSDVQIGLDLKANIDSPTFTGTVAGVTKAHVGLGNADNTSDANKPLSTAATTALNLKAPLAGPVFTGTTRTDDLVVDGDFTVNGTNFSASATSITIEDNIVQLAHQNPANTVDLGLVVSYNYNAEEGGMHAGLVRDVSESVWKLFKNVEAEPSTTVDFANGELDALQVGGFYASSAVIGGVNDTEIQYLNGVTSAIQDQLDDKLESTTAASTYAPIASPAFTGTVSGVTKAHVGLGNVDNSADLDKPISTLTQTALDAKAPTANPTFTGTVSGIDKSMVGLGNVDNTADSTKPVSTATQTALDLKAPLASPTFTGTVILPSGTVTSGMIADGTIVDADVNASAAIAQSKISGLTSDLADKAPLDSPTFTGTVAGITKTMVGLANVDNTADADKPVSTDAQAALDLKAPLANPTFTGTVAGVTKSMVGLGSADNTSDADKPISDDTQAALDLKAPLANPTFTGTVAGITKSMVGLGSVDNTTDANKPISTATQNALDLKAPLNSPTFTGTVTLPANTISQSMMSDDSVGTNEIGGLAVTTAKLADGAVTNAKVSASAAIDWTKLAISSTVDSTEIGYVNGVTSAIQTQLNAKAPLSAPTFTGTVTSTNDLVVDGNLTVNGTTFNASSTSITIEDNMVQLAHQNAANTVDLGLVVGYNDGAAKHAGLVRDVSDSKWKLFAGVTTEPTTTVDFTQGSLDALAVGAFEASSATIGSVSNTELQYLDGVSSSIQTQINAKSPTASPTFTGTVTVPNGSVLGTPTSVTLTNATGLPVSTGVSGLGSGVATFLGTPSSANLASMLTDEIGTGNVVLSDLATNAQSGGTYTLVLADKGKLIELSNGSANAVTIPLNSSVAFPVGTQITVLQTGSGVSQINVAAGVTLNATPQGTANVAKFRAQWSSITLIKRANGANLDTWVAVGDITA
jgi:hypothetical protein